jgi:hypothetical protein
LSGIALVGDQTINTISTGISSFDEIEYNEYLTQKQEAIDIFDEQKALILIKTRLNKVINT